MAVNFCGACGAPLQPGAAFCMHCGAPIPRFTTVDTGAPAAAPSPAPAQTRPPLTPPFSPQMQAPPIGPGYWPGQPYAALPTKKKSPLLVVAIVIVALVVVVSLAAAVYVLTSAKAHIVSITKMGLDGNGNMTFDLQFAIEGASIGVDKLHLHLRAFENGVQYGSGIYFWNQDALSVGTHTWGLHIAVDPNNLSAFTYRFTLEVNGSVVEQTTVT